MFQYLFNLLLFCVLGKMELHNGIISHLFYISDWKCKNKKVILVKLEVCVYICLILCYCDVVKCSCA